MTVAGTLFHRLTVMPAGSHERDTSETVIGHSAVYATVIPFTALEIPAFHGQTGAQVYKITPTHIARAAHSLPELLPLPPPVSPHPHIAPTTC